MAILFQLLAPLYRAIHLLRSSIHVGIITQAVVLQSETPDSWKCRETVGECIRQEEVWITVPWGTCLQAASTRPDRVKVFGEALVTPVLPFSPFSSFFQQLEEQKASI